MMLGGLLLAGACAPQLPELVVSSDDTVITRSCRVSVPAGRVIEDPGGDGVIHVRASGITVEFAPDTVLRGAPPDRPRDRLEGIGVRVDAVEDVVLRGLRVEGYRCGVYATGADGLEIDGARLRRNFAQHLRSTPTAEDGADWLWPHRNDEEQWRKQYGAGVCVRDSAEVRLHGIRVREQQNGIILDRVHGARVYDNDCSFLSGWGLAMWRSSGNLISRNAFDFCVRGYSHGVYNRGQDSAGILAFEQCSRNVFVENSATHGGDGFFGFAGREALGEDGLSPEGGHERAGCNDNLFVGNDFSYAVAHGLELTFSFGNQIEDNRFAGNAICGVWGGYSQDTLIRRNRFVNNGDMGYGLERGGVNVDHPRNTAVLENEFVNNACGVHLWTGPTDVSERPWGRANSLEARGNLIAGNLFRGDEVAVHLRGGVQAVLQGNDLRDVGQELLAEGEPGVTRRADGPLPALPERRPEAVGESRPVGARAALRGRENIIVTGWGPWDHASPLLWRIEGGGSRHVYEVLPPGNWPELGAPDDRREGIRAQLALNERGAVELRLGADEPGVHPYRMTVGVGGESRVIEDVLVAAEWEVRVFPTGFAPHEDPGAWERALAGDAGARVTLPRLRLPFGHGGASGLEAFAGTALPADHFGTVATTTLPLPPGTWRVRTLSDDGVRVRVDGEVVLENWGWHGPTTDVGSFTVEEAGERRIQVEHFELDGWSVLELALEPVPAEGADD